MMAIGSLRATRDLLMADKALQGQVFCNSLSDATDAWLSEIADAASNGSAKKIALVAVGGYGRRELCPFSDLDLLLIHENRRDIKQVADALWYPVWDQGLQVDHAVRKPKEVLRAASQDLRVALGLLDARLVWGDAKVSDPLVERVRALWETKLARVFLPALEQQMAERHRSEGDVAFLLEPNLKEAHGGLRDVSVLRAIASCSPRLAELVDVDVMSPSADRLTAVRVELHRSSGRALDRMLLQEQDQVAAALAYDDADDLCRSVSKAGRSIARLSDETWRRRPLWEPGGRPPKNPPERTLVEDGIVIGAGEVSLTPSANVTTDCSLIWRVAAVGAENDLPLSLGAVHRLAELAPDPPAPWTSEIRDSFVRLLSAGHSAIPAMESLDHQGLVSHMIPEWEHVRHHTQRNAYHRFTVDRHLLEAAANASQLTDRVDRPDLLVIGAFLHDVGKGLPGDHTDVGIDLVSHLAPRMGFSAADTETLVAMVRFHLLLPDTATRRDLSDPKTIETVASLVKDRSTLHLLAALTKADSLATGPSAWGPWKEQLVTELVNRTDRYLEGTEAEDDTSLADRHRALIDKVQSDGSPTLLLDPPQVVVAARDRPGLLADVAGALALHGLDVHTANAESIDGVALDRFTVDPNVGRWPSEATLRAALVDILDARLNLADRLKERQLNYARTRPWSARPVVPSVSIDNDASTVCTVVEVRAIDDIGLLHRLTSSLFDRQLDVVAARVATIGDEVIDSFYVRTPSGTKVLDASELDEVVSELLAIVSPESDVASSR